MGFLTFNQTGISQSGKTKVFTVSSNGVSLGAIYFYGKWRKYCFYPNCETLFDDKCLIEISDFMKSETDKIFGR